MAFLLGGLRRGRRLLDLGHGGKPDAGTAPLGRLGGALLIPLAALNRRTLRPGVEHLDAAGPLAKHRFTAYRADFAWLR